MRPTTALSTVNTRRSQARVQNKVQGAEIDDTAIAAASEAKSSGLRSEGERAALAEREDDSVDIAVPRCAIDRILRPICQNKG